MVPACQKMVPPIDPIGSPCSRKYFPSPARCVPASVDIRPRVASNRSPRRAGWFPRYALSIPGPADGSSRGRMISTRGNDDRPIQGRIDAGRIWFSSSRSTESKSPCTTAARSSTATPSNTPSPRRAKAATMCSTSCSGRNAAPARSATISPAFAAATRFRPRTTKSSIARFTSASSSSKPTADNGGCACP